MASLVGIPVNKVIAFTFILGSALAAIVSPLAFGYVIDKTGDWTLPFLGSIGLLLIGTIVAFWMKPDEELPGAALTITLAAKEAEI